MKYLFIILLFACSKEPERVGVTYYVDQYNDSWQLTNSFVSIHWHDLTPEELERFKRYESEQPARGYMICPPVKDFMRIEIKPEISCPK